MKHRVLSLLAMNFLTCGAGFLLAASLFAQSVDPSFPEILEHSDTNISVYEGDKIKLDVRVGEGDYSVTWIRQRQVLCKTTTCEVDTTKWSYGRHKVVLVVYNNKGSRSVTYQIRVFTREPGQNPVVRQPELVTYVARPDAEGVDDLVAKTQRGIVYSYSTDKIQVLAAAPRNLSWNETLKTENKSIVEFGRTSVDQHFLIDAGKIQLAIDATSKRGINLQRGTLRSRQLEKASPAWMIYVENKFEIAADNVGDVLVQRQVRGEKRIVVQTIRGVARVAIKSKKETKVVYVPQGVRMEFYDSGDIGEKRILSAEVGKAVYQTTLRYLVDDGKAKAEEFTLDQKLWRTSEAQRKLAKPAAVKQAREFIADNDPLLAIEVLKKFSTSEDKEVAITLAEAFFHIGAYGTAEKALDQSYTEEGRAVEWDLVKSKIWLLKQEYEKVFDLLYDRNVENEKNNTFLYYRGVAQFHLGLYGGAFNDFKDCSELCGEEGLKGSSRDFLKVLEEDKWFRAYGFIGIHYQGNLFRLSKVESHYRGYANAASGYYSGVGLWTRMYENRNFGGYFQFDLSRKDYFDKLLKKFEPVYQNFRFDLDFKMGGLPHKPFAKFTVSPYLTMQYFANDRIADHVGSEFSLGFPLVMFQPGMFYQFAKITDPLPVQDDILDPVTFEIVPASDRSTTLKYYGLFWNWYESESMRFWNKLRYGQNQHSNSNAAVTNYKDRRFEMGFLYKSQFNNHFDVSIFTQKRTYDKAFPQRIDDGLGLDLDWRHFVHPFLYVEVGLNYYSQDSTESTSGYSTTSAKSGFGVRF